MGIWQAGQGEWVQHMRRRQEEEEEEEKLNLHDDGCVCAMD